MFTKVTDPSSYEPEDVIKEKFVIFVVSTWEDGTVAKNASFLSRWLEESSTDFRMGSSILKSLNFAVFGIGSLSFGENSFCAAAKSIDRQLASLGAKRVAPLTLADVDEGELGVQGRFIPWTEALIGQNVESSQNGEILGNVEANFPPNDDFSGSEEESVLSQYESVLDVEDIFPRERHNDEEIPEGENYGPNGRKGVKKKWFVRKGKPKSKEKSSKNKILGQPQKTNSDGQKEMVTPLIRASLEKQVIFKP